MDAQAIEAMLREDRAEWDALAALLEAHPEGSLHDPASPNWTSRDVYAHMARWIEHSTAHLQAHLAGRAFPKIEGTDDEINARWQREDSGLSLAEARERARRAFERRIQAIQSVPPDRWDKAVEAIARADGADHYRGHRGYITAA